MNKYDLEHKLLKGGTIYLDNIPTYNITLGEMADNGFTKYQNIVQILCMDDEKAGEYLLKTIEHPSTFLFIVANILNDYSLIEEKKVSVDDIENLMCFSVPSFLSHFFRSNVIFDPNYGFVIGDSDGEEKYILNESNYDKFRRILKERNCLVDIDSIDETDNPDNEMAKILLEKRKKLREKVNKAKRKYDDDDDAPLTIADLISIFAEAEHMPLQYVYDNYDIYQFNNQFNRLKIMDDFHVSIQALLAGAKDDDFKLQHWISKIKKQEN